MQHVGSEAQGTKACAFHSLKTCPPTTWVCHREDRCPRAISTTPNDLQPPCSAFRHALIPTRSDAGPDWLDPQTTRQPARSYSAIPPAPWAQAHITP